jgi:hypothetical protein
MERGLMMLLHAVLIGIILYVLMVFVFRQSAVVAENRSILLAALILIYMVMFGHGMPTTINKQL